MGQVRKAIGLLVIEALVFGMKLQQLAAKAIADIGQVAEIGGKNADFDVGG